MGNNAFMTHNGLKVRLNHDYCSEYLGEDKFMPWYISIEAFDSLRGFLTILSLIVLMFTHQDPVYSGGFLVVIYLLGFFVSQSYFNMAIWNLLYGFIYMIYSLLSKFFIQYIAIVVISFVTKEYLLLISFLVARIICFVIIHIINIVRGKLLLKKYGVYLGDVEITAIKLINFYSQKNINYKQWITGYSAFVNNNEAT